MFDFVLSVVELNHRIVVNNHHKDHTEGSADHESDQYEWPFMICFNVNFHLPSIIFASAARSRLDSSRVSA